MRNAGLEEAQAGIKIARRNINNLRYADDTTLMAESEEELKSLLTKVKGESEKVGFWGGGTAKEGRKAGISGLHSIPMDCSPPGSSVQGILPARILEWIAISSSRGSSLLRQASLALFFCAEGLPQPRRYRHLRMDPSLMGAVLRTVDIKRSRPMNHWSQEHHHSSMQVCQ